MVHHRTALLKMHQYGHAGMLPHLTPSHMDQSEGSKSTWRILVQVSLRNSCLYQSHHMCNVLNLFERLQIQICPLWKPLYWVVCCSSWLSSQEFLGNSGSRAGTRIRPKTPSSRSPTSTISQRWPANLGSHKHTVLCEICSVWKFFLLTYSAFYNNCSFCLLLWNK